jgi:hypothetical protein
MQSDYDEVDYKICGELGRINHSNKYIFLEEKNRALDDFIIN